MRRLEERDWRAWADASRRAVASDPAAFSSTLEELSALTDSDWQEYTNRYCTSFSAAFVREGEGVFVAVVGVEMAAPVAIVTGLWVSPESRRRGVARGLMAAVEEWAREDSVNELVLAVAPGLGGAAAFYQSVGFLPDGSAGMAFTKRL